MKLDELIYERTDDMTVLSDFYCGIQDMDIFIHNNLQEAILREGLISYLVKYEDEILAVFSICDNVLKTKRTSGEVVNYSTIEIEYLAVRDIYRNKGIGRAIIEHIVSNYMYGKKLLTVSAYIDIDTKYSAEPFYARCGFVRIGNPPHALAECVRMIRFL